MIYLIIILFVILVIFYCINKLFKKKEYMTMKNIKLNEIFKENGYEIDIDTFTIKKCEGEVCLEKQYKTRNFNSTESHHKAKNKPLSNTIFKNNNIPVPDHYIIDNTNKYYYLNEFNIKFPCVLKPVDGMQGTDVYTFIKTKEQFSQILNNLLNKYTKIMFENQVYGDNYRIFVFNNKIMDIIKREQPFIIGNNIDTVEKLIIEKNKSQLKKKLFPIKKIDWDYIKEQGYTKKSIPEKNKKIFVTNTINFHNGANPVRIDLENVPEINKNMFIKAHKLIDLECSGIDYMSENIYIPYNVNDGHIIEINDMVDTQIHVDADNRKNPNFLFENIFNNFKF